MRINTENCKRDVGSIFILNELFRFVPKYLIGIVYI